MLITKSLKRPYFVTAYNGDFVQCVSPICLQMTKIHHIRGTISFVLLKPLVAGEHEYICY
jgi:hypothetical protein